MTSNRVRIVMGTPAFRYSVNESLTPLDFADSATIKLATEPRRVRFPANVEETARRSQKVSGSDMRGMTGLKRSTAGTLETILLMRADVTVNEAKFAWRKGRTEVKR